MVMFSVLQGIQNFSTPDAEWNDAVSALWPVSPSASSPLSVQLSGASFTEIALPTGEGHDAMMMKAPSPVAVIVVEMAEQKNGHPSAS